MYLRIRKINTSNLKIIDFKTIAIFLIDRFKEYSSPDFTLLLCFHCTSAGGIGVCLMIHVRLMVLPTSRYISGDPRIMAMGTAKKKKICLGFSIQHYFQKIS